MWNNSAFIWELIPSSEPDTVSLLTRRRFTSLALWWTLMNPCDTAHIPWIHLYLRAHHRIINGGWWAHKISLFRSVSICFFLLSSSLPPSLSLQTYGSLHYRWVCLRRQAKALRVWWILYIIKLHFVSIPTSHHYKGEQPQQPYEHECEQRATAGFFWARHSNQTVQSIKNFQKILHGHRSELKEIYVHLLSCLAASPLWGSSAFVSWQFVPAVYCSVPDCSLELRYK